MNIYVKMICGIYGDCAIAESTIRKFLVRISFGKVDLEDQKRYFRSEAIDEETPIENKPGHTRWGILEILHIFQRCKAFESTSFSFDTWLPMTFGFHTI